MSMDDRLLSPEEILDLAQKVKGNWVTDEWLQGEGADFKAGILNGYELALTKALKLSGGEDLRGKYNPLEGDNPESRDGLDKKIKTVLSRILFATPEWGVSLIEIRLTDETKKVIADQLMPIIAAHTAEVVEEARRESKREEWVLRDKYKLAMAEAVRGLEAKHKQALDEQYKTFMLAQKVTVDSCVAEAVRANTERIKTLLDIDQDAEGAYVRISNHVPYSEWQSLVGKE